MTTGIEVRHRKGCPGPRVDGKCCRPSYRAHAYDATSGRLVRRTFDSKTAARQWRQDAQVAIRRGRLRAPTALTVERAFGDWLEAAERGEVRNRSGDRYKPSALRSYSQVMALRVTPRIGAVRFSSVRRRDLQDLVDRLVGEGLAPATVMTAMLPLRAVYGRAVDRGDLDVNPTSGLRLPAVRGSRDRIADPAEAARLLAAVPKGRDRTVWATALYAGLRRGELIAVRWEDVDLDASVIRVRRGWDRQAGEVAPKSRDGRRTVPIAGVLRRELETWRADPVLPDARVFDVDGRPLEPGGLQARADKAWKAARLDRITLHECRHTFASLMIAAGVNAKALSTYLGHANIAITFDRYGHLMPGNEAEAAGMLDAYLAAADVDREG